MVPLFDLQSIYNIESTWIVQYVTLKVSYVPMSDMANIRTKIILILTNLRSNLKQQTFWKGFGVLF